MAQIKLKKLSGISVDAAEINKSGTSGQKVAMGAIATDSGKLVFAGQDYKGILDNGGKDASNTNVGTLELYLERPENYFKIEGVKANIGTVHEYFGKDAIIELTVTRPKIIEKDSGWFTTELTATPNTLKFGDWNDFDLPNQHYVDISFS